MERLSRFLSFVNEQAVFHENMAAKYAREPKRVERHKSTAITLRELAAEIERLPQETGAVGAGRPSQFFLSLDEIEGLPEDLIKELSISEGDKTDYAVLRVIEQCGGIASLDRILVNLFREHKEVFKRNTLTSRLYRMTQKGLLFNVPYKKGVYSTKEMTPEEAEKLPG
jgi:hypothetical protein